MKIEEVDPPRKYQVRSVEISHCANIQLKSDELVTFTTCSGKQYDVMKKSWGFFATPSINDRLKNFGYKTALIKDSNGKRFVCLIEEEMVEEFCNYVKHDRGTIEGWLSDDTDKKFLP